MIRENDNFYFANGAGLLEYDGERFQLVSCSTLYSPSSHNPGKVYTGAYGSWHWVKDDFGGYVIKVL
jgi:hypothetical protein